MPDNKIRLQKFLSEAGVASRRKSEELIADGVVRVNNRIAKIGDSVDPKKDTVTVRGRRVFRTGNLHYILLNKPRGYVTTTDDELGRKCVTELITGVKERIYPVGRLDRASEGALIMTNDGEFANAIMHPSRHVSKTYRVTVRPDITKGQIESLSSGIELDGRMTAPADVSVIDRQEDRAVVEIVQADTPHVRSSGTGSSQTQENGGRSSQAGKSSRGTVPGSYGAGNKRPACPGRCEEGVTL